MQELTALILAGGVGFFLGNLWYSHQERNSSDAKKDKTHLRNMDTNNDKEIYVGIDLGGTTVGVALINSFGKILNTTSCNIADSNRLRCGAANTKSPAKIQKNSNVNSRSFDNVVALIVVLIHEAMQSSTVQDLELSQIAGFGIGAPGLLDTTNGIIMGIANFDWTNVHITEEIAKRLHVDPSRVCLENDANAALLAEMWVGAGKGEKNVVMLTLGTGVGCAIMSDGQLFRGDSGDAGEIGHTIIVPNGRAHGTTGVRGIFEGYASATAVVLRTKEKLQSDSHVFSPLRDSHLVGDLSCAKIFQHAGMLDGDESSSNTVCNIAKSIVQETIEYIGIGCINVCRCYDPAIVILTGGMTLAGPPLLNAIRNAYCQHHWNITKADGKRLIFAKCGSDAGMVGAAAAAFFKTKLSLNINTGGTAGTTF